MNNQRAYVMSDNTEVFLLEYKDLKGEYITPTTIELTFSDAHSGKIFFTGDVTNELQQIDIGRYKYFYQIPNECDNLVVETKAIIDEMSFVDRAVAKVIESRLLKYPDGNPR